jgi:hypothetical protein
MYLVHTYGVQNRHINDCHYFKEMSHGVVVFGQNTCVRDKCSHCPTRVSALLFQVLLFHLAINGPHARPKQEL